MDRQNLTIKKFLEFITNSKIEDANIYIKHGEIYSPVYIDQMIISTKTMCGIDDLNKINTDYEVILDMDNINWLKQSFEDEETYDKGYGYQEDDTEFLKELKDKAEEC